MDDAQLKRLAELARKTNQPVAHEPAGEGVDAIVKALGRRSRPGERSEEKLLDLGVVDERELALE